MEMYRIFAKKGKSRDNLALSEAFRLAARVGGNVLVADGFSLREHAVLEARFGDRIVLVTTEELVEEAKKWIEGSFHEIAKELRIITWREIKELYEAKRRTKDLETRLGIL